MRNGVSLHFPLEPVQHGWVERQFHTNGFDSNVLSQFLIDGFIYLAHSATAEKSHNLESSGQNFAGGKYGGLYIFREDPGNFRQ